MKVWQYLLVFGILYIGIILGFSSPELFGDEYRYSYYAQNLTKGYYAEAEDPLLRNGPGYPLLLTPFFLLGLPLLIPKLLNAFMLVGAQYFLYQTLRRYTSHTWSLVAMSALGGVFIIYPWIYRMIPEAFTLLLVTGFIYHFTRIWQGEGNIRRHILTGGLMLGFLALTKFVFAYILMLGIGLGAVIWLLTRSVNWQRLAMLFGLGLLCCVPYLVYTYSLTGKKMYWGTNGGEQLYWMTSPVLKEWGNWMGMDVIRHKYNPDGDIIVDSVHLPVIEQALTMTHVERNAFFKEKAKENLAANPLYYLKNWTANLGRFFFMYPRSYKPQSMKTFIYLIPNMFIVVLLVGSVFIAFKGYRRIPAELWIVVSIFAIYFGASSLVSASHRYFLAVFPILLIWLTYVYSQLIEVRMVSDTVPTEAEPQTELV